MNVRSRFPIARAQAALYLPLAGCTPRSAPTLSLFGAYFPNWILCGLIGVVAAGASRLLFVRIGVADAIPAQLLVCTGIGVIVATLAWLWLGQ